MINMPLLDHMVEAFKSLFVNKFRSFFTMLGIIIGVFSVTTVVTIGEGGEKVIVDELTSGGTNLVVTYYAEMESRSDKLAYLTVEQAYAMKEMIPQIKDLSPEYFISTPIKVRTKMHNINVIGVDANWFEVRFVSTGRGRSFTSEEVRSAQKVCVMGKTLFKDLYGGARSLGQIVKIEETYFQVIGVMEAKLQLGPVDLNRSVVVPSTCVHRLLGSQEVYAVLMQAKEDASIPRLVENVQRYLRNIFEGRDRFEVHSMEELIKIVKKVTNIISIVLGSIAGVSLVVGGIGIMNIMLVSVRERTAEIGLRKALGATRTDILLLFLIESLVLCIMGGGVGLLLGILTIFSVTSYMGIAFYLPPWAVILGFGFSFFVGLFFGAYPAFLASRFDPVAALRYE